MKTCHQTYMMFLMSLRNRPQLIRRIFQCTALATVLLLTSCAALDAINATPIPTPPTETPLPTPTINWFPATATPTLGVFSTNPPTQELRPGLGEVLLTDDFSDTSLWDLAVSDEASAAIENNRLTLAAQSGVYMFSFRHDTFLNDYYAEITAQINLCRGNDDYGLLIRANAVTYYRFALSCNGTARIDRLSNGTRLNLQSPLPSGDIPPGAPGEVRIGVWAVGPEMRLFLNGRYQFSISEPSYPGGTIGVFVNSAGDTATIVSFANLIVQSVE